MPGMKLAKASKEEIDRLWDWLQKQAETDNPPPAFERVVFGYQTLLDNCADPAADVLEFKPSLKSAMEDVKRLDWLEREAHTFQPDEDGYTVVRGHDAEPFKRETLREAIDDAMKPEATQKTAGPAW